MCAAAVGAFTETVSGCVCTATGAVEQLYEVMYALLCIMVAVVVVVVVVVVTVAV